jgi:hypothetical protein
MPLTVPFWRNTGGYVDEERKSSIAVKSFIQSPKPASYHHL